MSASGRLIAAWMVLLLTANWANQAAADSDATATPGQTNATGDGDRPTPAQADLMQGVVNRKHQAAVENADSEHQAAMKKCEGLVWEEEKICKDNVSTETAQAQAKANKDREKRVPPQ